LCGNDLIIKLCVDIIISFDKEGDALILSLLKLELFHVLSHSFEFLGKRVLLFSFHCDFFNFFYESEEVELSNLTNSDFITIKLWNSDGFLDFSPVLIGDGLRCEAFDQWKVLGEYVNLSS